MTMMNSAYKTKTVFTVLNGSTATKVLWVCHNISSLQGVSTNVPLPHMSTSCPHDKMGSGVLVSALVEESSFGSWCSASASM